MNAAKRTKQIALYVRVSTDHQTIKNQERELQAVAERHGWQVVAVFKDQGISGAKGRNGRPGLDKLLQAVARKEFDLVAAWSVDRLGRSLQDLIGLLQELHGKGIDLYPSAGHRHHDASRQSDVPDDGRVRRFDAR